MKNQPNNMVTLAWLSPLLNQQLSQLSDGWQLDADNADFEKMSHHYHQISGVLIMANIPLLASIAAKLSLLAGARSHNDFSTDCCQVGQSSHKLLQRELTQYVQMDSYHLASINKSADKLSQVLSQMGISTDHLVNSSLIVIDAHQDNIVDEHVFDDIKMMVPKSKATADLTHQQYQQLLLVWRQHVQKLLTANANEPFILTVLEKVSQYLWHTARDRNQQCLWCLTELWLHDLAYNKTPLPKNYATLLSQLDHFIEEPSSADTDQTELSASIIKRLTTDIYTELSDLTQSSESTQSILSTLVQSTDSKGNITTTVGFLPRILSELETIIFSLDEPHALINPLQRIENQLERRGWIFYSAQVESILAQVKSSIASEIDFSHEQGQVERQLQELYSAIYNTEQAISTTIEDAELSVTASEPSNDVESQSIDSTDIDIVTSDNDLRELRIAVEDVKHRFSDYIQRHQIDLLPDAAEIIKISDAFDNMGLPSVRQATDKMATLFEKIVTHNIESLRWDITQALAESLTSVELLLDYLAQQVFDQKLLAKANEHIDNATRVFDKYIQAPDASSDSYFPQKTVATDVLRYDDSGEVLPTAHEYSVDDTVTTSLSDSDVLLENNNHDASDHFSATTDSEALRQTRTQVKPDNFDMDEEIRDIFIEEVAEVITDLEDFLPIWQLDPQDLTPLTELRRGFHTLKGSGRMVGAFSISEMAWSIENLLNRLLDKTLPVTNDVVALVIETTNKLSVLATDFEALQSPSFDPAITILQSNNLLTEQSLNFGLAPSTSVETNTDIETNEVQTSLHLEEQGATVDSTNSDRDDTIALTSDEHNLPTSLSDLQIPAVLVPFMAETQQLSTDASDADPDIKEIFIEEANEVLAEIVPLYEQWRLSPTDLTELNDVRRGFHTLKGSGRMVGANYTGELAWSIENMLNRVLDHSIIVSDDMIQLITDVLSAYPVLVTIFENNSHDYPAIIPLWVACANAYSKQQGSEFSYVALYHDLLGVTNDSAIQNTALQSDTGVYTHVQDNEYADNMLQTIYSINEIMAEAPVILTPQNEEERAFCEIFIEEAEALLQDINNFVNEHQDAPYIDVSDKIVRAFHTLRAASGSSSLVAISDVGAAIEQSLEQLQQQDMPMNAQHLQAIAQSVTLVDGYLNSYKQNLEQQPLLLEDNQSQQDLAALQAMLDETEATTTATDNKLSIEQLLDSDIDDLLDAEWHLNTALNNSDSEYVQAYIEQQISQIAHLKIKASESSKFMAILTGLNGVYAYLSKHPQQASDIDTQEVLLSGHAQLVGLFDALAGSTSLKIDEQVLQNLHDIYQSDDSRTNISDEDIIVEDSIDKEATYDESINNDTMSTVRSSPVNDIEIESIDTDAELLEIFLEEAQELDNALAESFNEWRADFAHIETLKVLQRHLHTIKGGARMAGIRSIGDLTHEAESIYEAFVENRKAPTEQWLAIMQMVQDTLSLQITHLANHQESFFATKLIEQLQQFERAESLPEIVTLIIPVPQKRVDTRSKTPVNDNSQAIEAALDVVSLDRLIKQSWLDGLPDPDILEVFLEEAEELTDRSKSLQLFVDDVNNMMALQALQRDLHTIKGGARMVSANGIADLAHEMEAIYESIASNRRPATSKVVKLLVNCHDWLADAVFVLKQQVNPPTPALLIAALQQFIKDPDSLKQIPNESLQTQRTTILMAKEKRDARYITTDISEMPSMVGITEQEQSTSSSEMIRISGGLIEHMINLSGESAINRARIDMGMSSLTNSIEEMGTTVQRLADQLRRMEIELEAQILSQIDEELITNEGFDPLEMDQYSSLNQLSKSLTESASDLVDINNTLLEKTRDSESLLLQLSRTQTELQDGLMNSRMVPFTRLTPRLERVVRQTANELNKSVELKIINADDEMDRTILERITSPLEHMLRNAIDHGIEDTSTRLKAGKKRDGHITLEVLREGSEIVINLADDGRGINVEAVREKAISQGLIDAEDTSLTDLDVIQYIFNAGLTTTKQVTQISGRGVGMDVVISEIRQLGGVVSVVSEPGKGSRFTIRVPLTVAVSDALVVRAADRYYAIPLVQIERVIRVNPEKLYDYYQSDVKTLNLEDTEYRVRYLNEILSGNKLNELVVNTNTSLPLIIIKNRTGQNIALQVDQIEGSRIEVVVKPLGRQLSHLAGISAATIMGDGSVMLILDLIALMRNALTPRDVLQPIGVQPGHSESQTTILVVDDSVTVRKVTSRFLERQGINVILAKDGIDAIEILQETIPDLILLDIEMPRMDGFEVATQVRYNKRLHHIPIIMITSRTGEKHRERALEIGVNDYMGKPFQENELLSKIQNLLGNKVSLSYEK